MSKNLPDQLLKLFSMTASTAEGDANVIRAASFAASINYFNAALAPTDLVNALRARAGELNELADLVEQVQAAMKDMKDDEPDPEDKDEDKEEGK